MGFCRRMFISFIDGLREARPINTRIVARAKGKNSVRAVMASAEPYSPKNVKNASVVDPKPANATGMSPMAITKGESTINSRKGMRTSNALDKK